MRSSRAAGTKRGHWARAFFSGLSALGFALSLHPATRAAPAVVAQHSSIPAAGPLLTVAQRADQIEKDKIAGVAAFEGGDFATATEYFLRIRQIDPTNDEAMFLLGRAYLATGASARAVDQFTSAIALNDKVEKYFYARAKAEMRLGQYPAAVADFNRDLELRDGKGSPIFYLARGDAYLNNGETALAIREYGLVLTQAGDLRLAYLHRGVALARTGDLGHALEDLIAAEAAGRTANALDFDTFFYHGVVDQLIGDKSGAMRDYRSAATFRTDLRKPLADCLAGALDAKRHGLFAGPPRACRDFDVAKALLLPPQS